MRGSQAVLGLVLNLKPHVCVKPRRYQGGDALATHDLLEKFGQGHGQGQGQG